jgi:molecular chaperone GrpE
VERDYADLRRSSKREVLGKLLTVKDNLERALHYGEAAGANNESIVEGVRLTQYQLDTVLQGEGVQPIEAEGKIFDPHLEEAVHRVNDPSVPDHTVVQVVRPGYTFGDDVLRPAQVSSACMETTISSDSARGLDHLAEGVGDSSDAVFGAFSLRRKASALTGIHLDSLTISNP